MTKYFTLTLLLISTASFSQLIIQGKIVEEKTKSPVRYASISITNSAVGMATNEQGNFQIKIDSELKKEKLKISSLGFGNRLISIDSLTQYANRNITILMKPIPITL